MGTTKRRPPTLLAEMARFPDMNPGPVVHMDRSGTILLANIAARNFFHRDTLVGTSWLTLCDALDDATWGRVLTLDGREAIEVERAGRCVMFTHVRSGADQTVFAFGADITERRRAERESRDQAARLAEVARFPDMNPGPVLRLDLAGCVLLANAAARSVFGEALVGRSWLDIVPTVSRERWTEIVATPEVVPVEARVGDRDYVFAHRRDQRSELVFVFGADVSAQKRAERALHQSEKLATLGTLAAGVAHELNNPAAAARRAAQQLRDALAARERAQQSVDTIHVPAPARQLLQRLDTAARDGADKPSDLSALQRSDRESELEEWLGGRGVPDGWRLAPPLVAQGLTAGGLTELAAALPAAALAPAVTWLAAGFPVYALLHEISEGSSRISEIVQALKSYAYLGQAPVQSVDLHAGIDSTLVILRSKLKLGITVRRDYDAGLPEVPAYGSELNQVWTNLLDNAAEALGGRGVIIIRTRRDGDWAVVDIEDDGPGIPADIQSRVFDPFFTTKAPGKGTGLGLSTSYSIITEKHQGRVSLESRPGLTRFTVMLPLQSRSEAPSAGDGSAATMNA